jgi:hypothetical protein
LLGVNQGCHGGEFAMELAKGEKDEALNEPSKPGGDGLGTATPFRYHTK